MSTQFAKHRRTLLAICVVCTGLTAGLHTAGEAYQSVELLARDWLATNPAARRSPRREDIVYLGIDDASQNLDTLFPEDLEKSPTLRLMKAGFPWNRAVWAAALDRLVSSGAKAVVFDMIVPAPRAGDSSFKAALDRFAGQAVIGSNLETKFDHNDGLGGGNKNKKPAIIRPSASLIPPEKDDSRVGFVNVFADADGRIRRMHFRTTLLEFFGWNPDRNAPELFSLAARALQKAGYENRVPRTRDPVLFRFSEDFVPRSFHEIFVEDQWQNPPYSSGALFKDKIVLIGAAGNQSEDRLQTPFGVTLGPLLHLSAINAALNGDFLHESSFPVNLALIFGAGGVAWMFGAWVRRPLLRLILLLSALAGYVALVQLLYNSAGFFPILLSPLLALGTSGFTWSVWEQVLDLREKARLRKTLQRYVSRDVARELLENPQSWLSTVGGVRKNVTVLFSDVRGFTTLTESAKDPQALVRQLNEYFTEMVRIVFENHGTLDKFIGDAVMAHWGSMVTEGEAKDACRAVAAAVQMRKELARLNPLWKERGMLELSFGIGLNHGEMIAGELGASGEYEKVEFTVIGDGVNLASRLEGVTKTYHIDLCIGESLAALVRDAFILRSLDLIVVQGKTKPVEIFTVLDARDAIPEPAWLAPHEAAMRHYRAGAFAEAEAGWRKVLEQNPGDGISELFLQRCADKRAEPPDPAWNGVFAMTTK
ncbi:MAG TPA: adenylate/guanylate cyclase domain-containing protein [Chthoniobacteraceae bacterium]